jgi:hypothetical protein
MLPNYFSPRNILEKSDHANFEAWAIGIGLAVSVAGTAYGAYSANKATNAANNVNLPKFVPIDIGQVANLAATTDKTGYAISDADWVARYPKLNAGRDYSINDAKLALSGNTDPNVLKALEMSGVEGTDISGNSREQAIKLGLPILSKEQRDRTYFQNLLAANPQRQFGLSGADVAHIAIANTNSQNNFNQGLFGSRINQYNASVAQSAQNTSGIIQGVGGLAEIGSQIYQNNQLNALKPTSTDYNYYLDASQKPALPYSTIGTPQDDPTAFHYPQPGS